MIEGVFKLKFRKKNKFFVNKILIKVKLNDP